MTTPEPPALQQARAEMIRLYRVWMNAVTIESYLAYQDAHDRLAKLLLENAVKNGEQ